jgi:hypothetical protein
MTQLTPHLDPTSLERQSPYSASRQVFGMNDGDVDYNQTAKDFRENRYLSIKNLLPRSLLSYLKTYYRILRSADGLKNENEFSLALGGDPGFDAILSWITPNINRLVGFDVAPTYSYTRVYGKGAVLERHIDRDSCEISVSVSIEIPKGAPPSILHLKPPNAAETAIEMQEGDAVIYAGIEIEHWRDTIPADGYIQLFLHFIDKGGKHFPSLLYDKRKYLGAPYVSRNRGS